MDVIPAGFLGAAYEACIATVCESQVIARGRSGARRGPEHAPARRGKCLERGVGTEQSVAAVAQYAHRIREQLEIRRRVRGVGVESSRLAFQREERLLAAVRPAR